MLEALNVAALSAIPAACFWAAWELRGIRERIGGVQQALNESGSTARAALVRADIANRRIDVLDRLSQSGVISFPRRNRDEKA